MWVLVFLFFTALLLALLYIKNKVFTLHDPGELGFINNRTLEPYLTLRHAAGFHDVPEPGPGFKRWKKRTKKGKRKGLWE